VPPRKKAAAKPPPLTDADVTSLRSRVQAGEKPRVIVRTASAAVPAGTRGNVIRVGNPADGEFIVVGLGKDQVPFAPNELALSARNGRVMAAPTPAKKSTGTTSARSGRARAAPPAKAAKKPTRPGPAAARATAARAAAAKSAVKVTSTARKRTTAAPRGRGKSRRTLPPLVVTLRFNNDQWTVEAVRGARRLAKATPVRPGAVKAFADLVDEPTVRDALTETVESSRSVVEERAAALRAELLAAEAALKEYEARRR
jgi:hypothetical protein